LTAKVFIRNKPVIVIRANESHKFSFLSNIGIE
jgi:hypothetical protein